MTRGAKIVVFSIVGLFVLAGMYFTFFAPPVATKPLADTTPTISESSALTLTPAGTGALDPITPPIGMVNDPSLAPAAGGFPGANDPAFARTSTPIDTFQDPNQFAGGTPSNSTLPPAAPAVVAPAVVADQTVIFPAPNSPAPSPVVVEKSTPKTNYTSYTVVSGDTLSSIAGIWFRDTSKWQLIADINPGLKPSTLKVGQKINLPAKSGKSATKTAAAAKSATPTAANEHVVASGETLASISDKAYGNRSNWKRIYEANKGVIGTDPSRLKVGMKLTIPSKT